MAKKQLLRIFECLKTKWPHSDFKLCASAGYSFDSDYQPTHICLLFICIMSSNLVLSSISYSYIFLFLAAYKQLIC